MIHVSVGRRSDVECGPRYIMDYYDSINEEYPEWLYSNYYDLPRVNRLVSDMEGYTIEVDITNGLVDGETFNWIICMLQGEWYNKAFRTYYFELEEDAMAFKLRWA